MNLDYGRHHCAEHVVDVCVVGAGMAGFCAALAAARHGAKVALMQDRPVLGGNASSECRMHICGADRNAAIPHMRETGILEEVRLENLFRNPQQSYSVWDLVLYEKARFEPKIDLLLNCSCFDAKMDDSRVESVMGWQLTTETVHRVKASIFIDCSGDGVLAPLTGAEFRMGREGRDEYGESIAPETADERTMGMTCMFIAREHETPQEFRPPAWAHRFESDDDLPKGTGGHRWARSGYWWIELGGEQHSIHDTEALRDELLKIVMGIWDHIKNRGDHGAENLALDWIRFLPAKRESRRYVGDHVLTQNDVESEGPFEDVVAYGGWPMDDHHPAGFRAAKLQAPATIFHPAPSPYGIPYRSLYSRNVENLMVAGRCASCTHAAMSSTRVMGTVAIMGQAGGTAAALAVDQSIGPRNVSGHMTELQQMLIRDDCYLPGVVEVIPEMSRRAKLMASQGHPEPVRDGVNRQVREDPHCWTGRAGDSLTYSFESPREVRQVRLILDTAMDQSIALSLLHGGKRLTTVPGVTPRAFRIEGLEGDAWRTLVSVNDHCQRHIKLSIGRRLSGVRYALEETWGSERSRVYSFLVE